MGVLALRGRQDWNVDTRPGWPALEHRDYRRGYVGSVIPVRLEQRRDHPYGDLPYDLQSYIRLERCLVSAVRYCTGT